MFCSTDRKENKLLIKKNFGVRLVTAHLERAGFRLGNRAAGPRRLQSFSVALAFLLLCWLPAASGCRPQAAEIAIHNLKLPDPDGQVYDLSADQGRVILVVYWATWCEACRDEMPMLKELSRKYAPQGLTILAWSVDDQPRAAQEVKKFINDNQINFKVLMVKDHFAETVDLDRVKAVPTFKLYGRDGRLLDSVVGGAQKAYWEVAVIKALRS